MQARRIAFGACLHYARSVAAGGGHFRKKGSRLCAWHAVPTMTHLGGLTAHRVSLTRASCARHARSARGGLLGDHHILVAQRPAAAPANTSRAGNTRARADFAAYTRGTSSLGARKGAARTRSMFFPTSRSRRPWNGRARAQATQGRLVVPKDQHFVDTYWGLRHPRGRETGPKRCHNTRAMRFCGLGSATGV